MVELMLNLLLSVQVAKEAIQAGKCAVIGLQSTGEARTLEQIESQGRLTDFVSTAKGVLQALVEKQFPVRRTTTSKPSSQRSLLEELGVDVAAYGQPPPPPPPPAVKRKVRAGVGRGSGKKPRVEENSTGFPAEDCVLVDVVEDGLPAEGGSDSDSDFPEYNPVEAKKAAAESECTLEATGHRL